MTELNPTSRSPALRILSWVLLLMCVALFLSIFGREWENGLSGRGGIDGYGRAGRRLNWFLSLKAYGFAFVSSAILIWMSNAMAGRKPSFLQWRGAWLLMPVIIMGLWVVDGVGNLVTSLQNGQMSYGANLLLDIVPTLASLLFVGFGLAALRRPGWRRTLFTGFAAVGLVCAALLLPLSLMQLLQPGQMPTPGTVAITIVATLGGFLLLGWMLWLTRQETVPPVPWLGWTFAALAAGRLIYIIWSAMTEMQNGSLDASSSIFFILIANYVAIMTGTFTLIGAAVLAFRPALLDDVASPSAPS